MKRRHRVLSRAEAEAALTAASAAIAPQDEKRGSNRRNTELLLVPEPFRSFSSTPCTS